MSWPMNWTLEDIYPPLLEFLTESFYKHGNVRCKKTSSGDYRLSMPRGGQRWRYTLDYQTTKDVLMLVREACKNGQI